eukprot:CAMPEP_0196722224 /NCGR_PEP_ID=MMETSP1091-20130531/4623_1 /TAXON_ID=302021 /ORGANISM="Rhodomonas sp., Strain CCMP768" /LENGTH=239 /DNA_ID=CAMNT_0042063865 /DNA_START=3 /DNA_END=722 /DNA_ORIENTATION=+
MDVARTAVRSAATGEKPAAQSASAKLSEMLASQAPNVNVSGLQKMGAEALFKVTEATKDITKDIGEATRDGFSNLVGGAWDPLGPPVVGASGPLARDISNVFDATLENRKQMGANISGFVKVVEAKTPNLEGKMKTAGEGVNQSRQAHDECKAKAENISAATDAVRSLCKRVQEKLQCETTCKEKRDAATQERRSKVEEIKREHAAETNAKREKMEADFKQKEEALAQKYSSAETEGFV